MTVHPPRWDTARLDSDCAFAIAAFRVRRMGEPLEDYLENFDEVRGAVENLLEMTVDLSQLSERALDVLTDPALLEAVRYLAGPPISTDDLKVVAEARLSAQALRADPIMAHRVIDTVLLGLDRNRFPWVAEDREPTEAEREAAAMASAALMALRS
ncbi:MAG: XamI family restriction endonuclease [Geodermatophilaceae bacterium]